MSAETITTTTTDETPPPEPGVTTTRDGRILPPPAPEPRPGKPRTSGLFPRLRPSKAAPPLTDAEADALAARVSDDPIRLADSDLACADCGRVVAGPLDPAAVTFAEPTAAALPGGAVSSSVAGLNPEPVTTCEDCATRNAAAADLTARYLPRGLSLNGLHHADPGHLVASALVAYDVLGFPPPSGPGLTSASLRLAVRHLALLGSPLLWSRRFAPVRAADAVPGTANPRRWAHVRESDRHRLRAAAAAVMADRLRLTAPPVALAPPALTAEDLGGPMRPAIPAPGGCLMCGVSAVTVAALEVARLGGTDAARRSVWTPRRMAPSGLGGRPSPTPLAGHTCPDCDAALSHAGAVGPSALERSLVVHLDASGGWRENLDALDGLTGWGALVADAHRRGLPAPPPNRTRWAHVGNLAALADHLTHREG